MNSKTEKRKSASERFAPGDVIRVAVSGSGNGKSQPKHSKREVSLARGPEAAVVVIDNRTRRVLAMAGGYSQRVGDFNRALRAKRQPGSTFKPLVYAKAIELGQHAAGSTVIDAPQVYDLWKPQNYKKGKFEGPVRLRHALAKSINTVSIKVLSDIGANEVVDLARKLGISSKLPAELSLALGSGEVTPLELTNAFAAFAAGGRNVPPQMVETINGKELELPQGTEALNPQAAYIVLDMMTSVVTEGTAGKARKLKLAIAGKTGTSNDVRDAWFVGLSPSYAVGVWVGFDNNKPLGRGESGGSTALPIFVDLMKVIGKKDRGRKFKAPEGLSKVLIDKATGKLAHPDAESKTTYTEFFIPGTEPTEMALAPDEDAADTFVQDAYDDDFPDEEEDGDE